MVQEAAASADKRGMAPSILKPADVKDRIAHTLANLPPFSPVLTRVMASLSREDVSFAKLADLIEKDTVLAGNVLRLVNSALYGRRGAVNSVRHAVQLLGLEKLRNVTLTMSVTRLLSHFKTPVGWSMVEFNLHSAAAAILSDLLSQTVGVNCPESAFAAGLFHDLGRLLVAAGLPVEYALIERLHAQGAGTRIECEQQVLGCTHAEISADALSNWNLPASIQTAVRYHHSPGRDPSPTKPGEFRLSEVLCAADEYVNRSGRSIDKLPEAPAADLEFLAPLGIGDRLPRLLEEFESEFESIKGFF